MRPGPRETVEHFNPSWFAAVMGTAVIPLSIAFLAGSWVRPVSIAFTVVSAVMFVVILVPWTLRIFMFPHVVREDLHHPIIASFYPTMPIAVVLLGLDLLRLPDVFFSVGTSHEVAFWLWLVGSLGIYVAGFIVLPRIYRSDRIELAHANFGWFIPPVAMLLVPAGGFDLGALFPQRFEVTFGLSMIGLGVGFFLFLFVGSLVYQRYVLESLPVSRFAATSFIAIAPTAVMAVVLFKLMMLFQAGAPLPIDPAVVGTLAILGILTVWGFSAWAFVMAIINVISYLRHFDLSYELSWWAYTFPLGAFAAATGVAWKVTGFESIHWFYIFVVAALLGTWILVGIRTIHGAWTGAVFGPVS